MPVQEKRLQEQPFFTNHVEIYLQGSKVANQTICLVNQLANSPLICINKKLIKLDLHTNNDSPITEVKSYYIGWATLETWWCNMLDYEERPTFFVDIKS